MATAASDLPSGQYYRDLNEYIEALERAGKLQRVTRPIDKYRMKNYLTIRLNDRPFFHA